MTRTKNRLFKTLVTVMLLFIMAFSVTGNVFAESTDVSAVKETVNVYYTQKTVTLTANYNCSVRITINVQKKQGPLIFKSTYNLTANEPIELNVEELFADETAIITEVSGDTVEPTASGTEQATSEKAVNNNTYILIIFILLGIIIILSVALVVAISNANSESKE